MSSDQGYLRTISCSISLSSCRVRAESLARALNSRLWSEAGFQRPSRLESQPTSCATSMAEVVDKPPKLPETFKTSDGYEIGHCWVNELPPLPDDDDSYDTPQCSSPPSPVADHDIIVNPPTSLPFCTTILKDYSPNFKVSKKSSVLSEPSKLRNKLQSYADSLVSNEDSVDTFYDAKDSETKEDIQTSENLVNATDETNDTSNNVPESLNEVDLKEVDITIEVHPPDSGVEDDPHFTKNIIVDRRLKEVKESEAEERPKLFRSTSLKTGKTPPGTPSRKKIVRFADVLGLDLEDVRHIVCEDVPNVPSSAFQDLVLPPERPAERRHSTPSTSPAKWASNSSLLLKNLHPLFTEPGREKDFLDRVRKEWVSLETVSTSVLSAHCMCRVWNVSYEKHVAVRYTTDAWKTWNEVLASYVPFSSDGEFDKFSFSLYMKPGTTQNQCLSFAIRYNTKKCVKWDNNYGKNYTLQYTGSEHSTNLLSTSVNDIEPTWLHHFC